VAVILELKGKRRSLTAKRGFNSWLRRFSEPFDENTSPSDLSDSTLGILIQGGEEASMPLYEFAMGVLNLGAGPRFYFMDGPPKMLVMDISLFLLDQLRFEAMKRLGWVEDHPTFHIPLLDLVQDFSTRFALIRHETPGISLEHPSHEEYEKTFEGDRGSFVRKLIPEALKIFDEKSQNGA